MVVSAPAAPARRSRRYTQAPRRAARSIRRAASRGAAAYGAAGLRSRMGAVALGGFGVGFIEKTFPGFPSLPIVGRKGAIALAVMMLNPKEKILQDVGMAAAAIAGYEFGKTGTVTGLYDDAHVFQTA